LCSDSQVSHAKTELIVGDVSLGVAVVSASVATWLFLRGGRPAASTTLPPREIFAAPTPTGAAAFWIERF
jgi:hypothetical protein